MPVLPTHTPKLTLPHDSADNVTTSCLRSPLDRQETLAAKNGLGDGNGNDKKNHLSFPSSSATPIAGGIPQIVVETDESSDRSQSTEQQQRPRLEHVISQRMALANNNKAPRAPNVQAGHDNSLGSTLNIAPEMYQLRKANSFGILVTDEGLPYAEVEAPLRAPLRNTNNASSRQSTFSLSVESVTGSDSVSLVDSDVDNDYIGQTSDLGEDMFSAHDNSGEASSEDASDHQPAKQQPSQNLSHLSSSSWTRPIRASRTANDTYNPVRAIAEKKTVAPNPSKPVISLSIGDPTFYGNMMPAAATVDAVRAVLDSGKFHGYTPAAGIPQAREAVAKHLNTWFEPPSGDAGHALQANDIFLTHGCSHALDLCLTVLCDSGTSNVLLPRPGFPLYTTLSMSRNVQCRQYRLLPRRDYEADLEHMETLIDGNTAAIVVTNPANPCGSVYSREHLSDIVALARRHQLPIIADEIYCDFVFHKSLFIPIGNLSDDVPVLSTGGLTKKYIVPGWRSGWVAIYDRDKLFDAEVRGGLNSLCQRINSPCSLIQAALPAILARPPVEHIARMIEICETNARLAHAFFSATPGVKAFMPQGAMYMMVEILVDQFDGTFSNDADFSCRLMSEQSVYCWPGSIFGSDNFVRLVLTLPRDKMKEAMSRMHEFCVAHFVGTSAEKKWQCEANDEPDD